MGIVAWWKRRWMRRSQAEESYLLALSAIRDVAIASSEAQEKTADALRLLIEQQLHLQDGQLPTMRENGEDARLRQVMDRLAGEDVAFRKQLGAASTLNEMDFS